MNLYVLDSLAVITVEVDARTEAEAAAIVYNLQGASFDTVCPRDPDTGIDHEEIRLRSLSTRCRPALAHGYDENGSDIAGEPHRCPDPERMTLISPADRAELTQLLAALAATAEGDSNDAEIDAAHNLAEAITTILNRETTPC